jgi:2-dehydro-3-deoxy-D-arabinonate dehydratase
VIRLVIRRAGRPVFSGETSPSQLKRTLGELASYLFRSQSFPRGVVLLTGTGIVPPDAFTLQADDEVEIAIPAIGTLRNRVMVV